ncbi:STAS domain-containing protein [Amycolatopsis suaedae]|nr:STAS domain-containing protein [Amycolatopsis suaedae]
MTEPVTRPPPHATTHLDVRQLRDEDILIISAAGEIDLVSLPSLRRAFEQPLPAVTICDLTEVTFMGVAGLGVLAAAATEADLERRRFGVVASTRCVTRLVTLFGLDRRFPVHARLPEAVDRLNTRPHAGLTGTSSGNH